jgi:glutamyl-tRNA reductase
VAIEVLQSIFASGSFMQRNINDISDFFVAGINYKKTEASIRGQFAINSDQYNNILTLARAKGIDQVFILSTCNRTEIYGLVESASQLVELLCSETTGGRQSFEKLSYIKNGADAIEHLFNVGGGLDSQILGDYEIVGQLKQAVAFARQHQMIGAFVERLMNGVLQSSKVIKNQTALSGGTVSVSFAAVQYIKKTFSEVNDTKILLIGVGKIGRITCKNLVDYLGSKNITLINRTEEKAATLAAELGLRYASFGELDEQIAEAGIIVVATNATEPAILKRQLEQRGKKLIIDLSIPYNVEAAVEELNNVTVVNVDELSKMKDETIQKRKAEIPKAKSIIAAHIAEFLEWYEMRKHVPVLRAVKNKLEEIQSAIPLYNNYTPSLVPAYNAGENIQKVINVMALKMRRENQRGCHYIEAINDFMAKL